MPSYAIFRLKNHALMMALAAAYPALSYANGAARLDFATGAVTAVSAAGVQRSLSKGAEVGSGDAVLTGDGGRAQLRFSDGGMVSLQPGSEFRIDSYQFSGKEDGQEKGFFSLLKGGLRSITGLVGRTNKSAYKVTTSVATIGIRGTEFTVSYSGTNAISVSTGEGMIEVCNNAGCALIPSGGAAVINGPNAEIKRTEVKPRLDPAQPAQPQMAVFSSSESKYPEGWVNVQTITGDTSDPRYPLNDPRSQSSSATPLVSGSGYAIAYAGHDISFSNPGFSTYSVSEPVTTTFSAANELTSFVSGSTTYTAGSIAGSLSADGVLGWGRWSSGSSVGGITSSLIDFHYVTGTPTPSADLVALGGLNATYTYNLIGYTLPTAQNGTIGQAPSGTLYAEFRNFPSNSMVCVSLAIPIGGTTFSVVGSQTFASASMSPTFSINTACASVNGFFAGANATHAGVAYKIDSGMAMGDVSGAAAFKR
jgi:hypothetical protein